MRLVFFLVVLLNIAACSLCIAQAKQSFTKEDYTISNLALEHVLGGEERWRDRYKNEITTVKNTVPLDTARLKRLDSLDAVLKKTELKVTMTGITTTSTFVVYDPDTMSTVTVMEYYAPPDTLFAEAARNAIRLTTMYRYDVDKLKASAGFTIDQSKQRGNGINPIADIAFAKPVFNNTRNRCCVYFELGMGNVGCAGFVYLAKVDERWKAVKYVQIFCK